MGCSTAFQGPAGTLPCAQGKPVLQLGIGFSPSYDDQSAATGFSTGPNQHGPKAQAGVRSGAPNGPVPSSSSGLVQVVNSPTA